ncbi:MAG: hypothetical protein KI785_03115 [Devosiaceae bacterium]|nr:hypothetical protein [Devosiaceae bacterium MH13]
MSDPYNTHVSGLESPASDAFAITPADGAALPSTTRAIYVGGAGSLRVTMKSGDTVTFTGVPAGTVLALRVNGVEATGTSATSIVGLV